MAKEKIYGPKWIKTILPHRGKALMGMRQVLEYVPGKMAIAMFNISKKSSLCDGHFPNKKILPGHIEIEIGNLTGGIILLTIPEYRGRTILLLGGSFENKKAIRPGKVFCKTEITCRKKDGKRWVYYSKYQITNEKGQILIEGKAKCKI